MPNKILFCATVDYHFKAFHLPIMEWFIRQGWEVHVAAKGELDLPFVDKRYHLSIERSPLRLNNRRAYQELKGIIREQNYSIIHCHTPTAGVLVRLAAQAARRTGTKVIYTAHGFHFCRGSSILNWLIYYPIEKKLSSYTDCLITINSEDYNLAVDKGFKAKQIAHVHGVGVNTLQFKPVQKIEKWRLRQDLDYRTDDFILFYAAEFNKNKNHQLLIRAIALIKEQVPQIKLLLAGQGPLLESLRKLASELGVASMVHFLGQRNDIASLLPMCDVAVASSLREGLPVNMMEAMACGLPIVATQNRGHSELVVSGVNGFIIEHDQVFDFASRLLQLNVSEDLRQRMGAESVDMVKKYALAQVARELSDIYKPFMEHSQDEMERSVEWAVL